MQKPPATMDFDAMLRKNRKEARYWSAYRKRENNPSAWSMADEIDAWVAEQVKSKAEKGKKRGTELDIRMRLFYTMMELHESWQGDEAVAKDADFMHGWVRGMGHLTNKIMASGGFYEQLAAAKQKLAKS